MSRVDECQGRADRGFDTEVRPWRQSVEAEYHEISEVEELEDLLGGSYAHNSRLKRGAI